MPETERKLTREPAIAGEYDAGHEILWSSPAELRSRAWADNGVRPDQRLRQAA